VRACPTKEGRLVGQRRGGHGGHHGQTHMGMRIHSSPLLPPRSTRSCDAMQPSVSERIWSIWSRRVASLSRWLLAVIERWRRARTCCLFTRAAPPCAPVSSAVLQATCNRGAMIERRRVRLLLAQQTASQIGHWGTRSASRSPQYTCIETTDSA
jgi:hypothetical protein